jgi:hypothetical protein
LEKSHDRRENDKEEQEKVEQPPAARVVRVRCRNIDQPTQVGLLGRHR